MLDFSLHKAPSDCIFIHGAGGNNLLWRKTLQYLDGPNRALAVNLPGHPSGEIACKTVAEYSESVHGFISDYGLGRVSVCGHSMGSAIALTLAIEHPENVARLILVSGGAKLGVSPTILQALAGQPLKAIEELVTPMSFHSVSFELGREARATLCLSNPPIFLNDYVACDGFDVRDMLPRVSAKTLIVCGESDRMTPPRYSHYMRTNIPNSTAFFIPGAGHMVPLEKPEALGRLVQSFLSELSR
jgi:pimeloyl-ACP methyl ester carboxylesterase